MIKQFSRVALMGVLLAALTAFTVGFQTIKIQTSAVCGMCKDRIEGTLNAIDGVEEARLDLTTKKVKIKFDDSKQSEASLKAIITKIGYAADDLPADETAFNALPGCCKSAKACAAEHPKTGDATVVPEAIPATVSASEAPAAAKACGKDGAAAKACCASKASATAGTSTTAPAKACCSGAKAKSCAGAKAAGTK